MPTSDDYYQSAMILFTGEHKQDPRRGTLQKSALHMLGARIDETADSYDLLRRLGFDSPTVADAVMLAMAFRAQRGDVEAARFLRDTSGQKEATALKAPVEDNIDRLNLAELSDSDLYALLDAAEDVEE